MAEASVAKKQVNALDTIRQSIGGAKASFESVFGADADKKFKMEAGFALMEIQRNSKLIQCSSESVMRSVASLALMNLTLNPSTKLAYLVPRGKECTLDISYMGMIEVLVRSGIIAYLEQANVVYANEEFEFENGTETHYIKHKRQLQTGESTPVGVYVIYKMKDGGKFSQVMSWNDVMKRKAVAQTKNVWNSWEEEMAIKTVIRRSYNFLPKTEQLIAAAASFDSAHPVDFEKNTKVSILD